MKPSILNPREEMILANADHFVAVRGRGPKRVRYTVKTLQEAIEYGATFGDNRTMCYAVASIDDGPCIGGVAHIRNC